jgi:putative ABC transport system permease protein
VNTITRGIRNAFRNVTRTGAIVLILGLSIGLVIAMLAARQAVDNKIETVKSSVGNTISVSPAGVRGFEGGGTALTNDELAKVAKVAHVTSVTKTLSDRLTTSTTNLESGIDAGSLGERRAGQTGVEFQGPSFQTNGSGISDSDSSGSSETRTFVMPISVTGVSDASSASTFGGTTVTWKSGKAFDASGDENVAVLGTKIAEKNSLSVGSTFTAYGETITVVGIYDAGNDFANNGVFFQLAALQRLSDQSGAITSATVTVDSLDNLSSATTAVKKVLGSAADVTSSQEAADQVVAPLQSVKKISTFSLFGAIGAGAVIILLTMMMIVRERRREIGVMKAIGSSNVNIVRQFVVEALTLTVLGLVIGFGIGIVAATPVTNSLVSNSSSSNSSQQGGERGGPTTGGGFTRSFRSAGVTGRQTLNNIKASVGVDMLALGALAAFAIAILGSAAPAFLISKIKPAEAMRNE